MDSTDSSGFSSPDSGSNQSQAMSPSPSSRASPAEQMAMDESASDAASILLNLAGESPTKCVELEVASLNHDGTLLPEQAAKVRRSFERAMMEGDDFVPERECCMRMQMHTGKIYACFMKAVSRKRVMISITGNTKFLETKTPFYDVAQVAIRLLYDIGEKRLMLNDFFNGYVNDEKPLFRDPVDWYGFGPRGMSLVHGVAAILPGCETITLFDAYTRLMYTQRAEESTNDIESREYSQIIGAFDRLPLGYTDEDGNVTTPFEDIDRAEMAKQYSDIIQLGGDPKTVAEHGYYGRYGFKSDPAFGGYSVKTVDMVGLASKMRSTGQSAPTYAVCVSPTVRNKLD